MKLSYKNKLSLFLIDIPLFTRVNIEPFVYQDLRYTVIYKTTMFLYLIIPDVSSLCIPNDFLNRHTVYADDC